MNKTWEQWVSEGIANGWCSELVCDVHDGVPWTDEEAEQHWDDQDFCVTAVRIYTGEPQ